MNFTSTWNSLLKHWISAEFFLTEGYVQSALWKELHIAPFVEGFKTATLGRPCWWILSVIGLNYLNIALLLNFCWWKVMYRVLYKRSCSLLLSQSALKQLLWEGLTDAFCQYLEPFTKTLHFCWIFAGGRLFIECSTNGASHYSFRRALWNSYFGKVLLMNFASTWNNLLKNWISSEFLQMEDYVEGALQKELHIVLFVERFKTTTLRKHHL